MLTMVTFASAEQMDPSSAIIGSNIENWYQHPLHIFENKVTQPL
jgi:hypothetical protein